MHLIFILITSEFSLVISSIKQITKVLTCVLERSVDMTIVICCLTTHVISILRTSFNVLAVVIAVFVIGFHHRHVIQSRDIFTNLIRSFLSQKF